MADTKETKKVVVDPEREARWEAFLAKAEKDNAQFSAQKEAGDFDVIPDSFV